MEVLGDRCGYPFPHQGPRMLGAACQRLRGHTGPHCSRHIAEGGRPAMWSDERIATASGRLLVSPADLTDDDGTAWT